MYMFITFQIGRKAEKKAKMRREVRQEDLEGDQREAAKA